MEHAGIGAEVEGVHAVLAAFEHGRLQQVWLEPSRARDERFAPLLGAAEAGGLRLEVVEDVRDRATTAAPQGVVAAAAPIPIIDLEEAAARATPAAIVILDHVVDPRNVGAVARTAVAAGMGALVVARDRAAPLGATAFKAAAGALEDLPVAVVSSIAEAVLRLSQEHVWVVALDGTAETSIFGLPLLTEPLALVIGGEGKGVGRLVRERADQVVRIPMSGGVESLNLSVAAAIAMFEIARVRGRLS